MKNDDMPIGINPIIINEKGQILLGKRKQTYGKDTYCLPGGKLRVGETFEQCVIREVKEETGLIVKCKDIEIINIVNTIGERHFIQVGALVKHYEGIPTICEPDKCADLQFFDFDQLPQLFPPNAGNIELFLQQKFYDIEKTIIG